MIQSMYNGASGVRAHQTQMDVIGNNIANINTAGFKSSLAEFKEALSRTLRNGTGGTEQSGGSNPMQVGLGVQVGGITSDQSQGSLQFTGHTLDIAIEGNGFLALNDGEGQYYTRAGALNLDSTGNLVSNSTGHRVMGWNTNPTSGMLDSTGALSPIQLPSGQTSLARQTGKVAFAGNLDATVDSGSNVTASYQIYDSLGAPHQITVTFTKSATPGEWTWIATTPDGTSDTADNPGTITFGTDGRVQSGADGKTTLTLTPNPNGANPTLNLDIDFSTVTALAGPGASTVNPTSQDGLPPGTLMGFVIESNGVISGTFSNGMTQSLARIAMANFANPNGLLNMGGNVFAASPNSGLPQIGSPDAGGRGRLTPGSLEMSNVDLTKEFTNMIVAQRGFQANSRVITVSDEMLQELISLKR